jgi:hypothetical protein
MPSLEPDQDQRHTRSIFRCATVVDDPHAAAGLGALDVLLNELTKPANWRGKLVDLLNTIAITIGKLGARLRERL